MKSNIPKIRVLISGNDFLTATLLLACAWGKLSWVWFWLVFVLNELVGILFNSNQEVP